MRSIFLTLCAVIFTSFAAGGADAQSSRTSVSGAEVTGTFRMAFTGKFKDSSNEIQIAALGHGKLHIAMELLYPYVVRGEMSANMGSLDGEATIEGDTAVYSSTEFGECTITIKFVKPGTISVSQDGTDSNCGFGHNVMADGTYKKVSSTKPKFESPEQ
ncbi:MAG: hypothetical protein ABJA02_00660 [Acidobacteriota bacterium]